MNKWLVPGIAGFFVVYAAWALVIGLSAAGVNLFNVEWDFSRTGALGDSFGVLGATMAGIAAVFAMATYREAAEENERLRKRQARMDQTAAEPSFLNLLERRFEIRDQVTWRATQGDQAIGVTLASVGHVVNLREDEAKAIYEDGVQNTRGLPQYFRFNYHILRYALDQFETSDSVVITRASVSYRYARLMRAQLSDNEACLIALNCIYGEGREKFKALLERYAMLHNVSSDQIDQLRLREHFAESAFGLPV